MPERKIQILNADNAIKRIVETVQTADRGEAPFALVVGSGFSHGLVPTAKELVEFSLPWWKKSKREGTPFNPSLHDSASFDPKVAREYWKDFVEDNRQDGLDLELDPNTGLPVRYSDAYKAAFDPRFHGAAGEPATAREFQRVLMRPDQPRLNAAHFLLGALLGVQPRLAGGGELFLAKAAFCRLILTTNFDPFLQIALQSVNRLYFMSDTPNLGVTDDILDNRTDAIHLAYVHGSIHRKLQAATDEGIESLKKKNAAMLAGVLKSHGVIVLGYSGWEDAIVEALCACDEFKHRLYWCGREDDPLKPGAFGPRVAEILRKPSACYVKIRGAGEMLAKLFPKLVKGQPRLLENPIAQIREMIEIVDLTELDSLQIHERSNDGPLPVDSAQDPFVAARNSTLDRLKAAERAFFGAGGGDSFVLPDGAEMLPDPSIALEPRFDQLFNSARIAAQLGNHAEVMRICSELLAKQDLSIEQRAKVLVMDGRARYNASDFSGAIGNYRAVIELEQAPVNEVATAYLLRGFLYRQGGEMVKAIDDYTKLIEGLEGAPADLVAKALFNRGFAYGKQGNAAKEIEDYTRVIEGLEGAPVEQVSKALINRGVAYGKQGNAAKEVEDYTRVIEGLEGAPVEQVAKALTYRGITYGQLGEVAKAIKDYTRVIEGLEGAPVDLVAKALFNRGVAYGKQGNAAKEIEDYTRVIEGLEGAPVEQVAEALFNRGVEYGKQGNAAKEIEDYTRVIEGLEGAPVDLVAEALTYRGITYGQLGEVAKAIKDYTRVIEGLEGAPVEEVANALVNRGVAYGKQGNAAKEIEDYTRVIEGLEGAPVELVTKAKNLLTAIKKKA